MYTLLGQLFLFFLKYYIKFTEYFDFLMVTREDNYFYIKSRTCKFIISPIIVANNKFTKCEVYVDDIYYPIYTLKKGRQIYIYGIPYSPSSIKSKVIVVFLTRLDGEIEKRVFVNNEKIII